MNQLKVKSNSNPKGVAGAITGMFKDGEKQIEIVTVGAGALNQAIKATAIARGYLAPSGIDIAVIPSFSEVEIAGDTKTAMCLTLTRL